MLLCKESRDRFIWWLYLALTLNAIVAHDDVWLRFATMLVVMIGQYWERFYCDPSYPGCQE